MYRIRTDHETEQQIAALPADLLPHFAHTYDLLELAPWSGEPHNPGKPLGAVGHMPFGPNGRGEVILEDQQRVDLLRIYWL